MTNDVKFVKEVSEVFKSDQFKRNAFTIEELEDLIGPYLKPDERDWHAKVLATQIEEICKRMRAASSITPLTNEGLRVPENIIIGACNLLDTIRAEWGDQWSEWDQTIRDGLSAALSALTPPEQQ